MTNLISIWALVFVALLYIQRRIDRREDEARWKELTKTEAHFRPYFGTIQPGASVTVTWEPKRLRIG